MNWSSAEAAAFRCVKPRRAGSRRGSTKEGRLVLPRLPDDGPAPPDKTRSGTGVLPSTCRTRPPRACRRRCPRPATSPVALAALQLPLVPDRPDTTHGTPYHPPPPRRKPHPTTQNTQPPTKRSTSQPHMSAPNRTITQTDPAASINRPCCTPYASSTSLCGAADQHSTSRREASSNPVDYKGVPFSWVSTPSARKRIGQWSNASLK